MRIAVASVHYHPESVGIGVYAHDMCRFFVQAGHTVSVVTGFPFYPELRRDPRYTRCTYVTEQVDGVTVYRCPIYVPSRWTSVRGRIANELSFAMSGLLRFLTLPEPDVLVVVSPPFTPAVALTTTARARGIPVAVHVQDLQPDAAAQLGMIRSPVLLRVLRAAERRLYRKASLISSLDGLMCERIVAKGVAQEKVVEFPNWVDLELSQRGDDRPFRREHGLTDRFTVVYSGSTGLKQGLELILEVAALAKNDSGVHFLIIGDGAAREGLETAARARGMTNISFLPLQPLELFPGVLAATDVALIPQRPEVRDLVVPSKLLRLLAGGCPVVAAAHPESGLSRVLSESGGGVVVPGGDAAVAWAAICDLKEKPHRRRELGERGRAYVHARFGREAVLARYLRRLEEIPKTARRT